MTSSYLTNPPLTTREKKTRDVLRDIADNLREVQRSGAFASLPAVTRALVERQAMKAEALADELENAGR